MTTPSVIETLGPMYEALIWQGLEYFLAIKDLAIDAAKFWYQIFNPNIQLRKPFKYENFELAANRWTSMAKAFWKQGHPG